MERFNERLGYLLAEICSKNIPNIIIVRDERVYISIFEKGNCYESDSGFFEIGDMESLNRFISEVEDFTMKDKYIVEFKNRIFDVCEVFDSKKEAEEYCYQINTKFELDLNWRKESERVKADKD